MTAENKTCPYCGKPMIRGILKVEGPAKSYGHLSWYSDKKYDMIITTLFGKQKKKTRNLIFTLLHMEKLFNDIDDKVKDEAWFCRYCCKITAEFDVYTDYKLLDE